MDIKSKDRVTLKAYFRKNLVPTESNFAELIDGMLNQKDDGIVKLPGDPLCIAAVGDAAGPQKVLNFYGNLGDANPAWSLQLNPRSDTNNPATAKPGFSISDGQGISRLFFDKGGNGVGIGTIAPKGVLDIANLIRIGLDEGGSGPKSISFARDAGDELNAGKISYKGGFGNSLNIVGAGSASTTRKIKLFDNVEVVGNLSLAGNLGIGTAAPDARLTVAGGDIYIDGGAKFYSRGRMHIHGEELLYLLNKSGVIVGREWGGNGNLTVQGILAASSSNSPPAKNRFGVPDAVSGIRFADNPGGGGSDAAWIQYYARNGEACTLEIGVSNDGDDHIALMPSGCVGIGTTTPGAKLDIMATTGTWNGWLEAIRFSRSEHSAITHPGGGLLFGMHSDRHFYFADTVKNQYVMTIDGPTGNTTIKGSVTAGNSDIYFTNTEHNHSGIGNTSGYAAIENAKDYDALMILGRAGTNKGRKIRVWDYFEVHGTFVNSSDINAKKDIEELRYGLEEVKKLRPVSFNWKTLANPHKALGLIAQDVQGVIDEVVYADDSAQGKGALSVGYINLIPVLINAIKELDAKLARLEALALAG